jgi:general secretion pathway protein E
MRQDPDIIMVGIRDLETAEMAIQAALTGHLVLSTLHTNDAPSSISRLIELGVPAYLIRATVLGVMAQRLVRTLCPHCKAPAEVDEQAWKELTSPGTRLCQRLGWLPASRETGYRGRRSTSYRHPVMRLPLVQADIERVVEYRKGTV